MYLRARQKRKQYDKGKDVREVIDIKQQDIKCGPIYRFKKFRNFHAGLKLIALITIVYSWRKTV